MKGKRRVENKAEMSSKGGEGKEEMTVLKLDGERGQGELIWCSPLGRNSHWSRYQTWPGEEAELEAGWKSKGRGGVAADPQHPKLLREVFPGPKGGQPCCPQPLCHPPPLPEHHLQPGTHHPVPFCKISVLSS